MSNSLPSGTLLREGRYRLAAHHRMGGQSVVYEGLEVQTGKPVIVKQTYEGQAWSHRVLREEANLLGSLNHGAIPRVLDCFNENGSTFLVMQRIPGGDIGEILKSHGGAFSHEVVLEWASQLLDILEYLQGQDPVVVHRDINPKNVRLTPDNRIFLLDFGIAKRADYKTYLVGGTPRYAPPEQLKDEGTDVRSDLYALAATLYYLLTAVEPPDALSRESAILKGEPDPLRPACELNDDVPPLISQVLSRSLSLDRERRPVNATTIRRWLREAGEGTYGDDEETAASPRVVKDSETTRLSGRESVGGAVSSGVARRGDSTEDAARLTQELERGSVQAGLIQVLIELMDNPPRHRKAILSRYSNLISKSRRGRSNTAIRVINALAVDAYIEPETNKKLRATLGRLIADHTLSEISANTARQGGTVPADVEQQAALTLRRRVNHREWLRELAVWAVRGGATTVLIDLFVSIVTGGKTIISLLSGGSEGMVLTIHVLLITLLALLASRIRRTRSAGPGGRRGDTIYYLLAFGCGAFLATVLYYDFMRLIGLT